jgi:hypothetical protein
MELDAKERQNWIVLCYRWASWVAQDKDVFRRRIEALCEEVLHGEA